MSRRAATLTAIAVAVVLFAGSQTAAAHDFRPGALTLIERTPGTFAMAWVRPVDSMGAPAAVTIDFPEACHRDENSLACGDGGLTGDITFYGLGHRMRVVVLVEWLDGRQIEHTVGLGDGTTTVHLDGPSDSAALVWLEIGVKHILFGFDHLAFVVALVLLLGLRLDHRLLTTLTAFTLAHSCTLALATLHVITLPSPPVEATIAASVVLLAREATHDHLTATRRAPWAVAMIFGLVHGLGFAGALSELGLPEDAIGWSLLWFNAGVEVGQILVVAAVIAGSRAGKRLLGERAAAWGESCQLYACYGIGVLATWWFIDRAAPIVAAWL